MFALENRKLYKIIVYDRTDIYEKEFEILLTVSINDMFEFIVSAIEEYRNPLIFK